jgi:aryl-alcohol dehydrogenase-like predicted oxidoreductase
MAPRYLRDQIDRSRANLGLETLDVYYVHNPETQLAEVDRGEFHGPVRSPRFSALEEAVSAGCIAQYGTATWTGYRVDPSATRATSRSPSWSPPRATSAAPTITSR